MHDTHGWSLDGEKHILSTPIVIGNKSTKKEVTDIKGGLKNKLHDIGLEHSTLDIEFVDEVCEGQCE